MRISAIPSILEKNLKIIFWQIPQFSAQLGIEDLSEGRFSLVIKNILSPWYAEIKKKYMFGINVYISHIFLPKTLGGSGLDSL